MKLKVLFFAKLREQVGHSEINLKVDESVAGNPVSVSIVIDLLGKQYGDEMQQGLAMAQLKCAVNQQMVNQPFSQVVLSEDDELAFFPPVTGG